MVLGLPLFNFGLYRDPICCSFLPSLVSSGSRDKGSSLPRFDQGVEVGLVEEELPQFTPPWKGHAYTPDRSRSLEVPNCPRRNAEVGSGSVDVEQAPRPKQARLLHQCAPHSVAPAVGTNPRLRARVRRFTQPVALGVHASSLLGF